MAHWQFSGIGGVWSRISRIGNRSSIWSDMNIRGINGKWKFMCDSSPLPKYATASSGHWVPGPVRSLEVFKEDARFLVLFRRVAPDIHLTLGRTGRGPARFLEPRVLI